MDEELAISAKLLIELIAEQMQQEASGQSLKANNHKLSEVALLLSKVMRSFPPACTIPRYQVPNAPSTESLLNEEAKMDIE